MENSILDFSSDLAQFSCNSFKRKLRTRVIRQISKGSFVRYMRIAFETESVDILLWLHLYTICSGSLRKAALKCARTQILYCCHGPAAAAKGAGESKQLHAALVHAFPVLGSSTQGPGILLTPSPEPSHPADPRVQSHRYSEGFLSTNFQLIQKLTLQCKEGLFI